MSWRWDQGRLEYFQVQNVRKIAEVLAQLDGVLLNGPGVEDPLRQPLRDDTGLAFPPGHYKVWRNFGRVFGQQLLATQVDQRLRTSELCQNLASVDSITDEQYLQFWVKRYTSPSPSFQNYDPRAPQCFPFCAVIKLALARLNQKAKAVTAEDAISLLIGNNVTGKEGLAFFTELRETRLNLPPERIRQIREMIAVIGQIPFLKWESSGISIDPSALGSNFEAVIMAYATPEPPLSRLGKETEILNQGSMSDIVLPVLELPDSVSDEVVFIEGSRKRMTHLRIERSSRLRQIYLERAQNPSYCNMCTMDTRTKYPWTRHLIEIHHLLPLGSLLRVEGTNTSLQDVIGICPTCHKATHSFYRTWLTLNHLEDFRTEVEARGVFEKAREQVVIAA